MYEDGLYFSPLHFLILIFLTVIGYLVSNGVLFGSFSPRVVIFSLFTSFLR
jgi:hypothetical protein